MRENGVTKEGERKRFLLFPFRRQKSMRRTDGNEVAGQRRIAWRDTLALINEQHESVSVRRTAHRPRTISHIAHGNLIHM